MTRVKKGGREYSVEDSRVEEYISKGYSVIDSRGNVIRNGNTTNYDALIVENTELKQSIKRLEASNADLASQLASKEEELGSKLAEIERLNNELSSANASLEEVKKQLEPKKTKAKAE